MGHRTEDHDYLRRMEPLIPFPPFRRPLAIDAHLQHVFQPVVSPLDVAGLGTWHRKAGSRGDSSSRSVEEVGKKCVEWVAVDTEWRRMDLAKSTATRKP